MAKHQATMKIEHGELTLKKRSAVVNFELRADGKKLGEFEKNVLMDFNSLQTWLCNGWLSDRTQESKLSSVVVANCRNVSIQRFDQNIDRLYQL